jgi:aspartyl-tRNA(Asn)/glutamyl-tRNA(Gln) amidotransferase subunit C
VGFSLRADAPSRIGHTDRLEVPRFFQYKRLPMPPEQQQKKIALEQVRHVAKLSRLALSEDQTRRFTPQLESILEYVAKLDEVDMSGVEPMTHALPLHNVLRDDVVEPSLPVEQVLLNAPESDGPFFKVPKVIGGDEDSAG